MFFTTTRKIIVYERVEENILLQSKHNQTQFMNDETYCFSNGAKPRSLDLLIKFN